MHFNETHYIVFAVFLKYNINVEVIPDETGFNHH